jgi:trk system potassium uptake protein TrkA
MRILIVGAGVVGFNLAEELSREGHDISIIDQDKKKTQHISDSLDVLTINGNACMPSVLERAGIRNMEMVIAVTNQDEINILICFLASRFNIPNRFARLRSMEFSGDNQLLPATELFVDHAINTGEIIISTILKIIRTPGVINATEFANGEVLLREFDVPENAPLAGKTIGDLSGVSVMDSFLVVAIIRGGTLIIPKPENIIKAGDKIYTVVDKEFLPFLLPMLNKTVDEIDKIVIFGATQVSINLAKMLENDIKDLSLIEPALEKANQAAEVLSKCVVHHGNGTDMKLFNEINISDADFFLALSDDDEANILSALLAKKKGTRRTLAISQHQDYLPILDSIGIDITLNPRLITISAILKHLRKGEVISVFKLVEGAEVMEILVDKDSSIVNKKISKLKFPANAMIGAILRKGEMMVPEPEFILEPGDSVILVALSDSIDKVEKLFGKKRHFLPF